MPEPRRVGADRIAPLAHPRALLGGRGERHLHAHRRAEDHRADGQVLRRREPHRRRRKDRLGGGGEVGAGRRDRGAHRRHLYHAPRALREAALGRRERPDSRRDDRADALRHCRRRRVEARQPRRAHRRGPRAAGEAQLRLVRHRRRQPRRERALQGERARRSHAHSLQGHERCERRAPGRADRPHHRRLADGAGPHQGRQGEGPRGQHCAALGRLSRRAYCARARRRLRGHQLVRVRVSQGHAQGSHRHSARGRGQGARGPRCQGKARRARGRAVELHFRGIRPFPEGGHAQVDRGHPRERHQGGAVSRGMSTSGPFKRLGAGARMRLKKLGRDFALEASGVDLAQPLSDSAFGEIEKAFFAGQVLVFRAQNLTARQFLEFARRFGPPEPHVVDQFHHPEYADILILSNVVRDGKPAGLADAGTYFHTDYSYLEMPARATMLYSIQVPRAGGDTLFANQYAAYDDLPGAMKKRLEGLVGLHHYGNRDDLEEVSRTAASLLTEEQKGRLRWVRHPLARRHPVTGRTALYAVSGSSFGIEGMPEGEARTLLDELKRHATLEKYRYRLTYGAGDVVIWDNASLLHSATLTDPDDARTLWRITIKETRRQP